MKLWSFIFFYIFQKWFVYVAGGEFIFKQDDMTTHNAELRNQGTNYSLIHSIVMSPKERGVEPGPGCSARSAALKFHFASLSSPWVKSY